MTTFMTASVRYSFKQPFAFSAESVFDWCTSFYPEDPELMGDNNAHREITQIADGSLILKDTFTTVEGVVEKQKLVQLYPKQFFWVSTHLTGPNKHSQFLYKITPQGRAASRLTFTALHLEYDEKIDAKQLAERLCKEDAVAWKLMAKAMKEDLKK